MKYNLLNGSNLSYIGDAYYELEIRKYLLSKNITKNKDLRDASIKFVSASAHNFIFESLKDEFTEEEMNSLRTLNKADGGTRDYTSLPYVKRLISQKS